MSIRASLVWLGALAVALSACTSGTVFELEVGDCFNDEGVFDNPEEVTEVEDVPTVSCSEEHDNEVYHVVDLPEGDFPGDGAVAEEADRVCVEAFEGFVGRDYATSELEFGWFVPTEQSWGIGDRAIACFLYRVDLAKMTGSMQGSGI